MRIEYEPEQDVLVATFERDRAVAQEIAPGVWIRLEPRSRRLLRIDIHGFRGGAAPGRLSQVPAEFRPVMEEVVRAAREAGVA